MSLGRIEGGRVILARCTKLGLFVRLQGFVVAGVGYSQVNFRPH